MRFYGNQGFIQFLIDLFEILNSKEISGLGHQFEFLSEINKHNLKSFDNLINDSSIASDNESDKVKEDMQHVSINKFSK